MAEITFGTDCRTSEPVAFDEAMLREIQWSTCGSPGSLKTVHMTAIMTQWLEKSRPSKG